MLKLRTLYEQLRDRIVDKASSIQTVYLYNGQFDNLKKESARPYPGVYFSIPMDAMTDMAEYGQEGTVNLTAYVAMESRDVENEDLLIFDLVQEVHDAIHGFAPTGFVEILCRSIIPDEDHTNLYVYKMTFITSTYNFTAIKYKEYDQEEEAPQAFILPEVVDGL